MKPTKSYPYSVVNVFTTEPLSGNSLAVFPDASEFDTETMQRIARELKLTETAFVLPATHKDCAARVRIFSPARELPFAGHPTVGTGFVLMQKEIVPRNSTAFVLQEQIGPVQLRIEAGPRPLICLRMPPVREGRCYDPSLCAQVLGLEEEVLLPIKPQLLNAGNPTVFVAAKDKAVVDRAWLDLAGFRALKGEESESFCVFLFGPTPEGAYSRMFAPEYGIPEDPATGSSTGPLAVYMIRHGLLSGRSGTRFVSEQGSKMGRRSLLHVEIHGENGADGVFVGGHVTPIIEAVMTLTFRKSAPSLRRTTMPLVHIDLRNGKDATYRQEVGRAVYDALLSVGVPNNDRFQIIAEHEAGNFLFDPDYLRIRRSQDLVIIQVTWNEGRSVDQKKSLYKAIADGLHAAVGLRREDVFINLIEVKKENWSFGNGEAQYAA